MHSVFSMRANSLTNLLAGQNRIDIGAAVNVEFSAGDKGRVVRSQIGNQAGYLVGLRKALEGNVRLECLGKAAPCYAHLPVVMDPAGGKMSKSAGAAALDSDRPGEFLFLALGYVGLTPPPALREAGVPAQLDWARANWTPASQPGGRRLPPPSI